MKRFSLFLLVLGGLTAAWGCGQYRPLLYDTDTDILSLSQVRPDYPDARFAVLADPHYHDRRLGSSGPAFQAYLDKDRKLLPLSREILYQAVREISREALDFVLVCGDLTKDGELLNHLSFAEALKVLEKSGKKVYVVPGNHDIANGEAVKYEGDKTVRVPTVDANRFKEIYQEAGYGESIEQDPDSLSYLAEPVDGLWLLAVDSCRWRENPPDGHSRTGGRINDATLAWIERMLIRSKQQGKAVIAFMHHGIMPHYPANKKYYGEYIVEDDLRVSSLFAAYGVHLTFTGHFHAQDITKRQFEQENRFVFDIETGSLVTAPCPYRLVGLSGGRIADIRSRTIDSTPSMGARFKEHASRSVYEGTLILVRDELDKYLIPRDRQALIAPLIADAYCAHLKGDEKPPEVILDSEGFGWLLKIVAYMRKDLVYGWWTDLAPADNTLTVDLSTGRVIR